MTRIFDGNWRKRALAGDEDAVRMLADAALGPLWSFCLYRVGGDRNECEEIVQETLVRALRELGNYEPERSDGCIFGWLTGLARNEIKKHRRQSSRGKSLDALWERMDAELLEVYRKLNAGPLSDAVLEREETRTMVNAAMSQLPPHYREALEAKYVRGSSVRDIATALGLSEKAAESQLTRAREAFKATFTTLARQLRFDAA